MVNSPINITNSSLEDIDEIFRLYSIASEYQKAKKTVVVWPKFKRQLVETEIRENRQFKMLIDSTIACAWAITFSDEQIWEERNADSALYIHRIAPNPEFRGKNFVSKIVVWAKAYVKANDIRFVRLDTLGNNTKLIEHYKNAGFCFLGMFNLKNTDTLPEHYKEAPVCLFQIDLKT